MLGNMNINSDFLYVIALSKCVTNLKLNIFKISSRAMNVLQYNDACFLYFFLVSVDCHSLKQQKWFNY